jgi:hypothetical protein
VKGAEIIAPIDDIVNILLSIGEFILKIGKENDSDFLKILISAGL